MFLIDYLCLIGLIPTREGFELTFDPVLRTTTVPRVWSITPPSERGKGKGERVRAKLRAAH